MAVQTQKNRDMAGKMSALEFSAAAAALQLTPEALAAARRVLVDGETQAGVVKDVGATKQTVNYWVTRVMKAHAKQMHALEDAAPAGWSVAILALPTEQMEKVKAQEALARATLRAQEVE